MSKETKEYRILSLDGSAIYRKTHLVGQGEEQSISVRDAKGKLQKEAFVGYLSRSLDTEKLLEVFKKRGSALSGDYKRAIRDEDDPVLPLLADVDFKYPCRTFNKYPGEEGDRYVRFGYEVSPDEWQDHCVFREQDGERLLIGIEVAEKNKGGEALDDEDVEDAEEADDGETKTAKREEKTYRRVRQNRLPAEIAEYVRYDEKTREYRKRSRNFPYVTEPSNREGERELKAENIRRYLYREGFVADGVRFVRYKRSAGSSRNGRCLFIARPLYNDMMKWTRCGLPKNTAGKDVVSFEAYAALTLSDMKWPLTLSRKSVLIMRDEVDEFEEDAVRISEKAGWICARRETCKIGNTIWDGEGLLEASCFRELAGAYPHAEDPDNRFERCGMVLLRNRFFKTCAFRTKIREWFAANGVTNVGQLNGYTEADSVDDIKLIVTESSVKYLKLRGADETTFREIAKEYLDNLFGKAETSVFGIVKTDKPTHHMNGDMVQTSYQLLSTVGLSRDEVRRLYEPSETYLQHIKNDPMYMRHYLNCLAGAFPDLDETDPDDGEAEDDAEEAATDVSERSTADAIMEVLTYRDDFAQTKYYKDFRNSVRNAFRNRIRKGRIPVDGTYATLFGNGAELLYAAIGRDYRGDRTAFLQKDQIYTRKFKAGTRLLCARSPHITMGNLLLTENTACRLYDTYFELSPEIVCVNAIGNNIQNRLNGCDYDSDMMLITDNEILVRAAARTYTEFAVPVCALKHTTRKVDVATADNDIANNMIGQIVNLSQYLNAKYWNIRESDPEGAAEMYKTICILAVMSGMEIDKAKRHYDVEVETELKRLGALKPDTPKFYAFITGGNTKNAADVRMEAAMSYVYEECGASTRAEYGRSVKLGTLIDAPKENDGSNDYRYARHIREAVEKYQKTVNVICAKQRRKSERPKNLRRWRRNAYRECANAVARNLKTDGVLQILLRDLDGESNGKDKISRYHMSLFAFIVLDPGKRFLKKILGGRQTLQNLIRDEQNGTVDIYGHKHRVETVRKEN